MNKENTKIFIVEDDNFFAGMLKETLLKNQYGNLTVVNSGEECLNLIHRSPDIVILDFSLGAINGIEVLRRIKGINPNIQVIFLSAQEKMEIAVQSLKYGAYDYLEKTDEGLKRLLHIIKRIVLTNKMVKENRQFRLMKKAFLAVLTIVVGSMLVMSLWNQ